MSSAQARRASRCGASSPGTPARISTSAPWNALATSVASVAGGNRSRRRCSAAQSSATSVSILRQSAIASRQRAAKLPEDADVAGADIFTQVGASGSPLLGQRPGSRVQGLLALQEPRVLALEQGRQQTAAAAEVVVDERQPHAGSLRHRARGRRRPAVHRRGIVLAEATGGTLVTMEGSGHLPQARDPVKVNLLLRDFIKPPPPRRWVRGRSRRKRALYISSAARASAATSCGG